MYLLQQLELEIPQWKCNIPFSKGIQSLDKNDQILFLQKTIIQGVTSTPANNTP